MFHYSFSAPLQAVTEIMENKDAAVFISAAWQGALGGWRNEHGPAPHQPPGAAPGRTRPAGPGSSFSHPIGQPGQRQLLPAPPRAVGLRQHGVPQHLLVPSGEAARARGRALTPAHRARGGQSPLETPGAAPLRQLWECCAPSRVGSPRLAALPAIGCSPQCSQPAWAGPCCSKGQEEGPVSSLHVTGSGGSGPSSPFGCRNTMHSLRAGCAI